MNTKFNKIFNKLYILYLIVSLVIICFELLAFKFKQIPLAEKAMISLLVCNIIYFIAEIIKPIIEILLIDNKTIDSTITQLKTNSSFLKSQNNDLIANNITPITTILIGAIAYKSSQSGFMTTLVAGLTLISCMAASSEIYLRTMINRLIEQINFTGTIIGEADIQKRKFLLKLICSKISQNIDVPGRLLVTNIIVIISTFTILL